MCQGQCGAGLRSACDAQLGYARCEQGACDLTKRAGNGTESALVLRGTYADPVDGDCATYFRCPVGWYKRFMTYGVVECAPCVGKQVLARYVSPGVSTDDAGSCLWECDGTRQVVAWRGNGSGCVFVRPLEAAARHSSGWYGVTAGQDQRFPLATCPELHTTEANTALRVQDCLPCPPLPENAGRIVGSRDCGWQCETGFVQRGRMCVRTLGAGWPCADPGTTRVEETGECVTSSVPWNRPGTGKAWPPVRVEKIEQISHGTTSFNGTVRVLQTLNSGVTIRAWTLPNMVANRHRVELLDRKRLLITEGPLCSATIGRVGGTEYLFGAVCNQSFLVYMNLSQTSTPLSTGVVPQALAVLIGQPGAPGWADGFKTQARFGTELYVASGMDGTSVWVLDRWNCVVREVAVWPGGPGDYRTRVYTVHGLTEKFLLTPPEPKCYGPGSLAGPRRFWDTAGHFFLFFLDDTGIWQLDLVTGAIARVWDISWDVSSTQARLDVEAVVSVWVVDPWVKTPSVVVTRGFSNLVLRICSSVDVCQYPKCTNLGPVSCSKLGGDTKLCNVVGQRCDADFCPAGTLPQFKLEKLDTCNSCPPGKYVATSDAMSCTDQEYGMSKIVIDFKDRTRWTVAPNEEPCAADFTSNKGGDCVIGCTWRADGQGYYVNKDTGACVSCIQGRQSTVCGVGEQLVECTRTAPAKCEACPLKDAGLLVKGTNRTKVYAVAGTCAEDEMRYQAPCPPGFYLGSDGRYCQACPDPLSTTVLPGATRVEQCKCKPGLVLSAELRRCVGEELYAYDAGACVSECNHPPNATVGDSVRCKWACDVGFYHSRRAGWLDKCQSCQRDPADRGGPATRGDDDSPRSCEYFPVGT